MADSCITIRHATKNDCVSVINLIKELADYEHRKSEVKLTTEQFQNDLITENNPSGYFYCLVAEIKNCDNKICGYLIFNKAYSTWRGRKVYIEDLFVHDEWRNRGIGQALLKGLYEICINQENVNVVHLVCLKWNKRTIEWYENHGYTNISNTEDWWLLETNRDQIEDVRAKKLKCGINIQF